MRIFCDEVVFCIECISKALSTALVGAYDRISYMTGVLRDRHTVSKLMRYRGLLTALGVVIFQVEYA